MIPIDQKPETLRMAIAQTRIKMKPETLLRLQKGDVPKPAVLETAKASGLLAAKKTPELIPHCHPIPLEAVELFFNLKEEEVIINAEVTSIASTGVEMEALTAASVAALTIYDMLKAIDKNMEISSTILLEKKGGKSNYHEKALPGIQAALLLTDQSIFDGKIEDRLTSIVQKALEPYALEVSWRKVLGNDLEKIKQELMNLCEQGFSLVLTVGGSGLDEFDQTVEAIQWAMTRPLPGVMEAARQFGQKRSPYALLSRGMAGQRGKTVLVPLPGSRQGLQESLFAILPGLVHGLNVLNQKLKKNH